jgi:hypothetical protein
VCLPPRRTFVSTTSRGWFTALFAEQMAVLAMRRPGLLVDGAIILIAISIS